MTDKKGIKKKTQLDGSAVELSSDPDFIGRLLKCAELVGSQNALAIRSGLSQSGFNRYFHGSEPSRRVVIAIADAAGVRVEWLVTGKGPMLLSEPLTDDEKFGQLLVSAREKRAAGREKAKIGAYTQESLDDYAAIPLYEVTAAAGGGAVVEAERVVDFLHFKRDWIRHELHASPADLYLINVDGESMEPTLRPGDVILVDHRDQKQARDGIYVLRLDGALLVKRLQKLPGGIIEVTSDNPAYKPFKINADQVGEDFAIIGRVVWSGRRM